MDYTIHFKKKKTKPVTIFDSDNKVKININYNSCERYYQFKLESKVLFECKVDDVDRIARKAEKDLTDEEIRIQNRSKYKRI